MITFKWYVLFVTYICRATVRADVEALPYIHYEVWKDQHVWPNYIQH